LDENKHFHIDIEMVIFFTKNTGRQMGQKQPDAAQLLTAQVTGHTLKQQNT
jgi:hypothetical protein